MEVAVTVVVKLDAEQFRLFHEVLTRLAVAQENTAAALDRINEYQRVPAWAGWRVAQPQEE